MNDFDSCFEALIGNEGKLSMDPHDRGNWTTGQINCGQLKGSKYGVSAAAYPNLDIEHLTVDDAKAIYRRDYWAAAGCEVVPEEVRFDVFDMAVNSGVKASIRALQAACGAFVDGVMGQETLMRTQSMGGPRLRRMFNAARIRHITDMPSDMWLTQGRGLMNRIANNLTRD